MMLRETIHTLPQAAVYQALQTRPEGLSQAEAEGRLQQCGRNVLHTAKGRPLSLKFLANFTHLMALLLWVGGLIGFLAQMPQLGIAIWLVNVINGVFSFWQEYKAERATEALRRLLPAYARVVRNNLEQRILAEALVPGDVMLLAEGDHVSADARLVLAAELRIDQSTLNGESHPVRKTSDPLLHTQCGRSELTNLVFAGTSVAAGTGTAVVFATAMDTEFGKIAHLTQSLSDELSPLQKEMGVATKVVTVLALTVGLIFFILAVALARMTLAEGFIFAMGMIVAFVPEGMLPTVTLALAMGVQRMARRNALVKRLSAVETLGCTSVICTDKTGTLTENAMTARYVWLPDRQLAVSGVGYSPQGQLRQADQPVELPVTGNLRQLLLAAGLCNTARLVPPEAAQPGSAWTVLGDPTEAALRVVAIKGGLDLDVEARRTPQVREIPFDSRRKRMSTIHKISGPQPQALQQIAYLKGAPKEVLALCTRIQFEGRECALDGPMRERIVAANDCYATQGLRVLALAQRALPEGLADYGPEVIERDLTFLGLAAMLDPPRPEVTEAVAKCHQAGIRIIMITGDYGLTAESIAQRIGLLRSNGRPRLITGVELETMTDEALQTALHEDVIFARAAPEHKLRVVGALQTAGHVVAVTGDGVNDAPALKKADIGVAMGRAGTEVAKETADMILTDDNFASIVNAVEEGRTVYANIKKFITYIFTSNTPEAVPFVIFAFTAGRVPLALNVMQILAIDLGTDMVPALALGAELPEPGVMDRPPRRLNEHVITWPLLRRAYVWLGLVQSLAMMAAFYFIYWSNGYWGRWIDLPAGGELYRAATAMALASVVMTQIGNLFAQRAERRSIFSWSWRRWVGNRLIWLGIATELGLVFAIVYVPFFQWIFGTAAFPLSYWLFLFAWTPALLIADEVRKAMVRRRERGAGHRR